MTKRGKGSNRTLLIVLALLVLAGISVFLYTQRSDKHSYSDKSLIETDTTDITGWQVTTPGSLSKTYTINRNGNGWTLQTADGKSLQPRPDYIRRCLKHLQYFKPSALAGVSPKDWKKFRVNDSGTVLHIIVKPATKKPKDIILGDLVFVNSNKASYYVRRKDETETYTVDLYLDGSLKASVQDMTSGK